MAKRTTDELIQDFQEALAIDKHSLDDELQRQPKIFAEVGDAHALAVARRDHLKDHIAKVDAELYAKHRRVMEKAGTRATEAALTAAVAQDPAHTEAVERHIKAKLRADRLAALKDAFAQRSSMIRDLASLYVANYFERNSMVGNNATKDIRAEHNIDKIDAARKAKKRVKE